MVVEYAVIDRLLAPLLRMLDHRELGELRKHHSTKEAAAVSENPTVERLCIFLWIATVTPVRHLDRARDTRLEFVRIREDERSVAEIHG
jgi:hypothetical protein